MARPRTQTRRPVGRPVAKKSPKKGLLISILVAILLSVAGLIAWLICTPPPVSFNRATLDEYVKASAVEKNLGDGAAFYIDMSDGMLSAYKDETHKRVLETMINKFAAIDAIEFFTLSNGKIEPKEADNHTALFNYVTDNDNYEKKWSAPIEDALKNILDKKQPAILMSDFEEYNGGKIQHAAYAKKYFIEWLAEGYIITFYKWNFIENGVAKSMFIAVFDDNNERLNSLVSTAVKDYGLKKFVLAGKDFAYPTSVSYNTVNQGGGYPYQMGGNDLVTNIQTKGGSEDYYCYASPKATASGIGQFSDLTQLIGNLAEYYPLGVTWNNAIKHMQDYRNIPKEARDKVVQFTHLLQGLYIGLNAQSGYEIVDVELRVFNISPIMDEVKKYIDEKTPITIKDIEEWDIAGKEVFNMLTVSMDQKPSEDAKFYVDIHSSFDGVFGNAMMSDDVLRANIVVKKADVRYDVVKDFFAWEGNTCLSDSVIQALEAHSSSPVGRVLYTYYFKAIEE